MMDYNFVLMMVDDFVQKRIVRVADGSGGYTTSLTTIATFKGRLDDELSNETIRVGQDVVYISHRLFTYPNSDIRRDDRISGLNRELRVVYTRTEYLDHPMEVLCQEIDP